MKKTHHIILLLILLFFGLTGTGFIKGSDFQTSRTFDNLWNFGHLILFLYFNFLLIRFKPHFLNKSLTIRLLIVFGVTTVLGIGIEVFQQIFMGGDADIYDIIKNYIGALAAFILFWQQPEEKLIRRIFIVLLVVLFFFSIKPVVLTMLDEHHATESFPVLSDIESKTELERYSTTDMPLEMSHEYYSHGQYSLKTKFIPRKYSTLSLNYIANDWSEYQFLKFDIYNPGDSLAITCRINDKEHRDHSNAFNDRFNTRIMLLPGWNNIKINLAEVRNAPAIRRMNMQNMLNWAIFTTRLKEKRTIYLDFIRLE